jgi:hypothetical protein
MVNMCRECGGNLIQCAITLVFLLTAAAGADRFIIEDARVHEDFSHNSLGQWSSYPPVQDAGYDPSLSPTSNYGAPGGRALMRVENAVTPGLLRFGFIKKLDLVATTSTVLSFSQKLKPTSAASWIEVGVAGGDGRLYRRRYRANVTGDWAQTRARFPELPVGTHIDAVFIIARIETADPDITYRFLIDDVTFAAGRRAHLTIDTPRTVLIRPWTSLVSSVSYVPGEWISVSALSPVPLAYARCELVNQDGQRMASVDLKPDHGVWKNHFVYRVQNSDSTGVWHALVRGESKGGKIIDANVRMLVHHPLQSDHPRLYFNEQDRAALLLRTKDPRTIAAWRNVLLLASNSRKSGDLASGAAIFRLLDPQKLLPTLPAYFDFASRASARILNNALDSYVTRRPEAMSFAKSALLDVSRWGRWAPPWFEAHGQHTYYPAGELASDMAIGYDVLYNSLSNSERDVVRRDLIDHGIRPAYQEYVLDNRIMANTSNWIGHSVGGAIVAALAVADGNDDPDLNVYLGGLLMKFEDHLSASYLADGSYGEGISYQEFDLKSTTLVLSALERAYGIDYWHHSFVSKSLGYPLYTMAQPIHESMDMGDSHPPSGYSIAGVVQHSDDLATHWYYNQFDHYSINDFLFPPRVESEPSPPMLQSRVFDQKGNVVFRTGSGPNGTILLFRAGPNFNHNHADQGSFLIRALGENFAIDAGYADYYKDPYYATYFSQAAGHNTILVDGDPASQEIADTRQFKALDAYPRLLDAVTSGSYDAVGSELSAVYKGRLKSFTRRIVFLKPSYVVVYDDLETQRTPAEFDWLLHVTDRKRIRIQATGATYDGVKAAMSIRALEPDSQPLRISSGHLPTALFAAPAPKTPPAEPGILHISSGRSSDSEQYLVLLTLARDSKESTHLSSQAQKIRGQGCVGLELGGARVLFRGRHASAERYAGWTTDAQVLSLAGPVLAGELVTTIANEGKMIMKSDRPVSFVARRNDDSLDVSYDAPEPATFRYFTGFRPTRPSGAEYDEVDRVVQIRLPAGRGHVSFIR